MSEATTKTAEPVRFSSGPITATIFRNPYTRDDGSQGHSINVTLQRAYKDDQGKTHYTSTFSTNDLQRAILVLQQAQEHLLLNASPKLKRRTTSNDQDMEEGAEA